MRDLRDTVGEVRHQPVEILPAHRVPPSRRHPVTAPPDVPPPRASLRPRWTPRCRLAKRLRTKSADGRSPAHPAPAAPGLPLGLLSLHRLPLTGPARQWPAGRRPPAAARRCPSRHADRAGNAVLAGHPLGQPHVRAGRRHRLPGGLGGTEPASAGDSHPFTGSSPDVLPDLRWNHSDCIASKIGDRSGIRRAVRPAAEPRPAWWLGGGRFRNVGLRRGGGAPPS